MNLSFDNVISIGLFKYRLGRIQMPRIQPRVVKPNLHIYLLIRVINKQNKLDRIFNNCLILYHKNQWPIEPYINRENFFKVREYWDWLMQKRKTAKPAYKKKLTIIRSINSWSNAPFIQRFFLHWSAHAYAVL